MLIDPLLGEPLPVEQGDMGDAAALAQARERTWLRPIHIVKLASGIDLPLHQHPYLVELQGPNDPTLTESLEIAAEELSQSQSGGLASSGSAPHRIGGWLQSSLSATELTKALSAMMRVSTQAFTTARYQRLADRRAMDWLRQVAGDERVAAQLGCIQSWSYLDPCGRLAQLRSSGEVATPLRLTQTEWAAFMKGALLHPTVARWLGERAGSSDTTSTPDTRDCYRRASAALERAEAAARRWPPRFPRPSDRVAWAALVLLHPDIEQCAEVVAALTLPIAAGDPPEPIETLDALSPMLSAMCLKAT